MAIAEPRELIRALVVDDKEVLRRSFMNYIREKGFEPVGAASRAEALRELRSMPSIDIIYTDMDLQERKGHADTKGEELAIEIKKRRSDIPIVAFTAHTADEYRNKIDWTIFDKTLEKGSSGADDSDIDECHALAVFRRQGRMALAIRELDRLQKKYSIDDREVEILRRFLPGVQALRVLAAEDEEMSTDAESADEMLRRLGFRLNLIDPGAHLADDGTSIMTTVPIAVWLQSIDNGVIAEVYDFPELYATAVSEEEAVRAILILMHGFYDDLRDKDLLKAPMSRLKAYLGRVFSR